MGAFYRLGEKYESKVDIWVVKNCSLALHKKLSRLSAILHVKISNVSMSTNLKIGKKMSSDHWVLR